MVVEVSGDYWIYTWNTGAWWVTSSDLLGNTSSHCLCRIRRCSPKAYYNIWSINYFFSSWEDKNRPMLIWTSKSGIGRFMKRKFFCQRITDCWGWKGSDVTTLPTGHYGSACTSLVKSNLLPMMGALSILDHFNALLMTLWSVGGSLIVGKALHLEKLRRNHKVKKLVGKLIQSAGMLGSCCQSVSWKVPVCVSVTIVLSLSCVSSPCTDYCNGVVWVLWCQWANTRNKASLSLSTAFQCVPWGWSKKGRKHVSVAGPEAPTALLS